MNNYSRYIRQTELIGAQGQDKLNKSKVLCVGAGGLGTLLSAYLVSGGVGEITLVDGDQVEISNLNRQITYTEDDCGKNKTLTLKEYLGRLNSSCKVSAITTFLDETNAYEIISKHDLIIDCSDNFKTRYLVNDACKDKNKHLVSGSIDGFMGQVMIFLADVCYRCVFPEARSESSCVSGNVVGPIVGIIASMMANEVFKLLTQFSLTSQLIQVNGLDNTIVSYKIKPDPGCKNNHYYDQCGDSLLVKPLKLDELVRVNEKNKLNNVGIPVLIDLRNQMLRNQNVLIDNFSVVNLDDILTGKAILSFEQKIVVLCNYGYKSKITALQLANLGYKQVYYASNL